MKTFPLFAAAGAMFLSSAGAAHHSFAPHFDAEQPVSVVGTVIEYERRNPHAYLHIEAEDADGLSHEWVCESHGVTQLSRNGITPDMLTPGTQVRVDGSRHRRDPYICFFDTVHVDGRELSVDGPQDRRESRPRVAQRDSIFGTWLLEPANRSTSGPRDMMNYLTSTGEAAVAEYDPFTDDPTFRCEPVAIRRAWFAPGTPMAIERAGENIVIRHEWMDVERVIHMNRDEIPAGEPPSMLGYSIGRFEDDTLVIETENYTQGILRQYVEREGEPTRGMVHSDQLRTVERISFEPETNSINLRLEHYDPVFYSRDFPVATARYAATDLEIQPFGCEPKMLP